MARDQFGERLLHPFDRHADARAERPAVRRSSAGVPGNAAAAGSGGIHVVEDRLDLVEQRLRCPAALSGKSFAEQPDIVAPVRRHVDAAVVESGSCGSPAAIARAVGDAEPLQHAGRAARPARRRRNHAARRRSDTAPACCRDAPCADSCGNSRRRRRGGRTPSPSARHRPAAPPRSGRRCRRRRSRRRNPSLSSACERSGAGQ